MFHKYSQEELAVLNSSNIVEVASSIGINVSSKVDAKGYQRAVASDGKLMTKLAFNQDKNSYYDFERGEGGAPLNFLMSWGGKTFPEAIDFLKSNSFSKSKTERSSIAKKAEAFVYNFRISPDKQNLKNYLINERKISSALVDKLLQVRLIDQDSRKNILFHYKKGTQVVGAVVQGTFINYDDFGKRGTYKGIAKNSESNFGFHFSFGKPTKLYVFEAPIDAMSYYTLNQNARCDVMYGSMGGLKRETIQNFVKYAKSKGVDEVTREGIYVSVDNDVSGIKFWSNLEYYNTLTEGKGIFKNNIPDFYSVPREVIQMYQASVQRFGTDIDLKPLLAVHKYESNFSMTEKKLANAVKMNNHNEYYFKYFGEPPQPKASEITPEGLRSSIDTFVSDYLKNGQDLKKTLYNPQLSSSANQNFYRLVERLEVDYQDQMIVKNFDSIQKDWNDVLKAQINRQAQFAIDVSNPHELEEALRTVDYHQIAPADLKAAGIKDRQDVKAFNRNHEVELELE